MRFFENAVSTIAGANLQAGARGRESPDAGFCTWMCKHERQRVKEQSKTTLLRSNMKVAYGYAIFLIDGDKT